MSIRNAAKAIVLHENRILLNQCCAPGLGEYFALPGGGQNQYETMEEAIVRECLEETGYTVIPDAFVGLYEEIRTCESFRQNHPDYAHKIFHIFRCALAGVPQVAPLEQDVGQENSVWIHLDDIESIRLFPICIRENMGHLARAASPLYLGSRWVDDE